MKKRTLVSALYMLYFAACSPQDTKYVHPCQGKYGSETVIQNIKDRHNLKEASIVFKEWYVDPARIPSNCDTIHLNIAADNAPLLLEDSFAISVGRLFFDDPSNSSVRYLYIEGKDLWPSIGKVNIKYLISKEKIDAYRYQPNLSLENSENQQYRVIERFFSKSSDGEKALTIVANLTNDVNDPQKLAKVIKEQYRKEITDGHLTQFSVELRITSPFCKLCQSKTYLLFFDKANGNM